MWHGIIKTTGYDSQRDALSAEALVSLAEQMRRGAEEGEHPRRLVSECIDHVPAQLYDLVLSGRAAFAPAYDEQGRLIEISIVPVENLPE